MDYGVTLEKEIAREVIAGLLADIDREIDRRGIVDEKDPLCVLASKIAEIWGNILGDETYSTMEDMLELRGVYKFSQDYIKSLVDLE